MVRGGYGWYYSSAQWNNLAQNSTTAPPAQITSDLRTSDVKNPDLKYDGIVGQPLTPSVSTAPIGVITSLRRPDARRLHPTVEHVVARTIGSNLVFEAQYLGSKSTHLEHVNEYNDTDGPGSTSVASRVHFPKSETGLRFLERRDGELQCSHPERGKALL